MGEIMGSYRQTNQLRLRAEPLEDRRMLTVPAFGLADLNPASPTFLTEVGPDDFAGQVSGWYIGRST